MSENPDRHHEDTKVRPRDDAAKMDREERSTTPPEGADDVPFEQAQNEQENPGLAE